MDGVLDLTTTEWIDEIAGGIMAAGPERLDAAASVSYTHLDVYKRQELHNALVEAQSANKAKTSFLNNMSHDIRTPINGIIGMLTILEKSGNDGERAKDCMNKINESSKLLLSLSLIHI